MNDGSRGRNPGHRQVVDPSTTDESTVARGQGRLAPFTSADLLDSGQYEASRTAELRQCVSRSVGEQSLERETQPRRSRDCGKALLLEDTQQPDSLVGARPPCKRKRCPDCGPVENAKRLRHFLALMDGHQMRRRRIEPAARRATLAKLRRAGHCWVPIPSPDGMLVLWATGGRGELVTDVAATLAADLAAAPAGRPIVPSRGWSRQPVASRGQGRFKLVGQAAAPMPQVVQAFKDADAYRGQVATEALPAEWVEAHLFTRPADELTWQRIKHRIGLHWPEHRQRRRKAA